MEAFGNEFRWSYPSSRGIGASWRAPGIWCPGLNGAAAAAKYGWLSIEGAPAGIARFKVSPLWRPTVHTHLNSFSAFGVGLDASVTLASHEALDQQQPLPAAVQEQGFVPAMLQAVHGWLGQSLPASQPGRPATGDGLDVAQAGVRIHLTATQGFILADGVAAQAGLLAFGAVQTPNMIEQGPYLPGVVEAGVHMSAELVQLDERGQIVAACGASFLSVPFRAVAHVPHPSEAQRGGLRQDRQQLLQVLDTLAFASLPQRHQQLEVYARMQLASRLEAKLSYELFRGRAGLAVGLVA